MCESCSNEFAKIYCVDCDKQFCMECSGHIHHPGMTKFELHSLEIIKDDAVAGAEIITPLCEEIFMLGMGLAIYSRIKITEDYLYRADMCPLMDCVRPTIAWIDTSLFYYYKDSFMSTCSMEDSFWKFIVDTWVRTILTESDSMLLVLQTFPKALLLETVYMAFIVPVLATVYALMLTIIRRLERKLERTPAMVRLERISKAISIIEPGVSPPPFTSKRMRPDMDTMEGWQYRRSRKARWFWYYYSTVQVTLCANIARVIYLVLAVRCICIAFDCGWLFRYFSYVLVSSEKMTLHSGWFERARNMFNTDAIFWNTVKYTGSALLSVRGGDAAIILTLILMVYTFEFAVRNKLIKRKAATKQVSGMGKRRLSEAWYIPCVLIIFCVPHFKWIFGLILAPILMGVCLLIHFTQKWKGVQKKAFKKAWNKTFRAKCVGPCTPLGTNGDDKCSRCGCKSMLFMENEVPMRRHSTPSLPVTTFAREISDDPTTSKSVPFIRQASEDSVNGSPELSYKGKGTKKKRSDSPDPWQDESDMGAASWFIGEPTALSELLPDVLQASAE